MIAVISRGRKVGGLMVYLLGAGDHNEHVDRHIIAGSATVMREGWMRTFNGPEDRQASRDVALAIAHELDIPRKLYGTQARMRAKPVAVGARGARVDVVERARKDEEGELRDAPVWHCVLSAMPGEELSDEKWAQIADDFMTEMGFTASADGKRAQARWVAARHGRSGKDGDGQEHVHIAASLVREDGARVNTFDFGPGKAKGDWSRAKEVCGLLEQRYGLQVMASREQGGELSGNSRAEIERGERERASETDRELLRRIVRTAAVGAENETDFVTRLREAGLMVQPRWAAGGQSAVTGYKVRRLRDGVAVGPWLGGGTLAKDLNLSALREQQWQDSDEARAAAIDAWKGRTHAAGRARGDGAGRRDPAQLWQQAAVEFADWQYLLREIPRSERGRWAWTAGQAAGVFSAWSRRLEGETPGPLAAAAAELTRSAQLSRTESRYRPGASDRRTRDITRLLLDAGPVGSGVRLAGQDRHHDHDEAAAVTAALLALLLLLLLAAIAAMREIARAHRERGELARAIALGHVETAYLDPLRQQWQRSLDDRGYDIGPVVTAVQEAVVERRVVRAAPSAPTVAPAQDEPVAEQEPELPTPPVTSRMRRRVTAAMAPLTPPSQPAGGQAAPRPFYTELDPQERALKRIVAVSNAQFAHKGRQPTAMSDAVLASELEHLRTEVALLGRELAEREQQGPHVRQVHADAGELTRKAELIEAALRTEDKAQRLQQQHDTGERELRRLREQLDETPRRKIFLRQQLQADITTAEQSLAELDPDRAEAAQDARAAAAATGSPRAEWSGIQSEASPRQREVRLAQAERRDADELAEDRNYLGHLRRDLGRLEDEHARRAALPSDQREADRLQREQHRRAQQARPRTPGIAPPVMPPQHNRDERGHER